MLQEQVKLRELVVDVEHERRHYRYSDGNICADNPKDHFNAQLLQFLFGSQMLDQFFKGGELTDDAFFSFRRHCGLLRPHTNRTLIIISVLFNRRVISS